MLCRKPAGFDSLLECLVIGFGLVCIGACEACECAIGGVALAEVAREGGGIG
jgi:hypothetical protein